MKDVMQRAMKGAMNDVMNDMTQGAMPRPQR